MAKMSNRGPTKRFLINEMDRSVKRMLKLIEDEGDSFAKKAEIYIQKRPELISQVENFYRMFRTLAERYDDATCELRSEPPSTITSPEHPVTRRLSGTHAIFLDVNKGYETSMYDSGSDQDDSSFFNSYSSASNYGNYRRLRRKITELESELKKIQIEQEVNKSNPEAAGYEEELRTANEKIRLQDEEICELKTKLEKYESVQQDENYSDDECEMEDEVEQLKLERDEVVSKLCEVEEAMRLKDDQIDELNVRLVNLQLECERSNESVVELEKMVEKQREMIEEGVEEKRQTERQLCISLEHYRNAYQMLRKGLMEQKNPVMAS
ncbi:putative protein Networked (NET), actin-binding (NAB) [Helianthus debilis subsp. tardiflorus]